MRNKRLFEVTRIVLWAALIAWTVFGITSGWSRTVELLALKNYGKQVTAQVIGCQPMPAGVRIGFVHYAFNMGAVSIDSRLEVPVSTYGAFHIGQGIPITYLPQDPHTVKIGNIDSGTVARSAIIAIVFLLVGLIAFGLPLLGIGAYLNPNPQAPPHPASA